MGFEIPKIIMRATLISQLSILELRQGCYYCCMHNKFQHVKCLIAQLAAHGISVGLCGA